MSEASAVKAAPQTTRLAITAFILGLITFISLVIVGLLLTSTFQGSDEYNNLVSVAILAFPLPDLATLVRTVLAWRRIKKSDGHLKGRGFTLGGLLLSIATLLLIGVIIIAASTHETPVCSTPAPTPTTTPVHGQPPC